MPTLVRLAALTIFFAAASADTVLGIPRRKEGPDSTMDKPTNKAKPFGEEPLCQNLTFVTRAQWGAKPPKSRVDMPLPVGYAIAHHTDTPQCHTLNNCSAQMRMFQKMHMEKRGWDDIGYNLVIGGDEKIYMGRGWDTVGAHAGSKYYNHHSQGIAVIGDYMEVLPQPGVLKVLNQLMECGVKSGYLTDRYVLRGHRDVRQLGSTLCPGDKLYAEIRKWPHYQEPQN